MPMGGTVNCDKWHSVWTNDDLALFAGELIAN